MKRRKLLVAVIIAIAFLHVSASNGQQTNRLPNGVWYIGEMKDGKPNGRGTEILLNGTKYVGEFKDGKPNGQGTWSLIPITNPPQPFDARNVAPKVLPAIMLVVASDANGKEIATANGFLVSADGKLITNHQVIEKASTVVAKSENGELFPVQGMLADDPKNDLALLKLKNRVAELPFLKFTNTNNIEVGTHLAIIPSPLGEVGVPSEGIVSAVRDLQPGIKLLQLFGLVWPGSNGSPIMAGSPILNANGEIVGVVSALLQEGKYLQFAVPGEFARDLVANLKTMTEPTAFGSTASMSEVEVFSDSHWRAAINAQRVEDYSKSIDSSKKHLRTPFDNVFGNYLVGSGYEKLNFLEEARTAFQQAIEKKPDDAGAWRNRGFVYWASDRTSLSADAFRQAVKISPEYADAWNDLGYVCSWCTDCATSDDPTVMFRHALKINSNFVDAWRRLGLAYYSSERTNDAISTFRQEVKIKPDDALGWYLLGMTYRQAGSPVDATNAFQRARELDPNLFK